MPRYIAIEPIEHAGGRAEPGETLELTEAHAAQALAMGHIKPVSKATRAPAPPPASTADGGSGNSGGPAEPAGGANSSPAA